MDQDKRRNTAAMRVRVDNFTMLIAAMRQTRLVRDEFSEVLGMSPSGARKYILELRNHNVIVVAGFVDATPTYQGQPVYALANNESLINDFLVAIALPVPLRKETPAPSTRLLTRNDDPARHVYTQFDIKLESLRIPAPDPLLAHLFGRARTAA